MTGRRIALSILVVLGGVLLYGAYRFRVVVDASQALVEQPVRLSPDRRFLIALGDLDVVTGAGRDTTAVEAAWDSSGWSVRRGAERIARLSELPDYAELRALLAARAARAMAAMVRRDAEHAGSRGDTSSFPAMRATVDRERAAMHALRAVDAADRLWSAGAHDAAAARAAADALALLVLETEDHVGGSDSLAGRALAVLALASAMDSTSTVRSECLIADHLGYGAAAFSLASRLPGDDPRRWYVMREDARLAAANGPVETRYLWLTRLAARQDLEAWGPIADGLGSDRGLALPLLATGLAIGRFETEFTMGARLAGQVAYDLRVLGRSPAPKTLEPGDGLGDAMTAFEEQMAAMPPSADGPVLDRSVIRAYYRTCMYSAMRAMAAHVLFTLGTLSDAQRLATELRAARPGPAREFANWYGDLVSTHVGQPSEASLRADLKGMRYFGQPLVDETVRALVQVNAEGRTDYSPQIIARLVAKRLDSRAEGRSTMAYTTRLARLDPLAGDSLYASAVRLAGPQDTDGRIWWARYDGDVAALVTFSDDPRLTDGARAEALEAAAEVADSSERATVRAAHERLLAARPGDYRVVAGCAAVYAQDGDSALAEATLTRWLAHPHSEQVFDEVMARTTLTELLQHRGRAADALTMVTPAIASWKGDALERAALILEDLGRTAQAETLAIATWERYPDAESARALAARMLWRAGDVGRAARILADHHPVLEDGTCRDLLVPELIALDRMRPGAAMPAIESIGAIQPIGPYDVEQLAKAASAAGQDSLAFEIESRAPLQADGILWARISAYRYLRRAKGDQAAYAWIHDGTRGMSSVRIKKLLIMAFGLDASQLLWDMPWPGLHGDDAEGLWSLRAAAVAGDPSIAPGRQREVRDHFALPGRSRYRTFGRVLLGLEPPEAALHAVTTHRARAEAMYYIGLHAQQHGDLRAAAGWYARSVACNELANVEHAWAYRQLVAWVDQWHSMRWIAHRAAAGRPATARS